ncbi:MAG TPA: SDR family NAD(P)-dependent oxidoreductase, partial [Phormidium sp.]
MTNQNNRTQWDFGRFIQTLAYFEVIPFFNCLQRLFQGRAKDNKHRPLGDKKVGTILVAGATGGVGKRVVRRLVESGYKVRSLVRDSQRAKEMLGENTELVEGDITIPETLTEQVFKDVTAVVCCTGTRVQPVEGDTADRAKYYQGIKFYMPEVVDVPEVVEYQGIKNLVQAAAKYLSKVDE